MKKNLIIFLYILLGSLFLSLNAQEMPVQNLDSSKQKTKTLPSITNNNRDTIRPTITRDKKILQDSIILNKADFKPSAKKAVIYSAIFPGLGQFYNRKYWKLPLVYGGAIGLTYAISWNGARYGEYNQAYGDFMNRDKYPDATSWHAFIRRNETPDMYLGEQNLAKAQEFASRLKRQKNFFRRNRDLAIIATVGVYVICMIDAYVDAQLYDFDMSPDLTMRVEPIILIPTKYTSAAIGLQCSLTF